MRYDIQPNSEELSVVIRILDSTTGAPEPAVAFDTAGLILEYQRELEASVTITPLVELVDLTTAFTERGFIHRGNGNYRLDVPNAAIIEGTDGVLIHGTAPGMHIVGAYLNMRPIRDIDVANIQEGMLDFDDLADGLSVLPLLPDIQDALNLVVGDLETIPRNTALPGFPFRMLDSARNPLPGLIVTARRRLGVGALDLFANPVVELSGGDYSIDWEASDNDAPWVMVEFSAPGAVTHCQTYRTQGPG